jgi:outer membrane cobalamin receptor
VFGGPPNTSFPASRRKVHASRVRSPEFVVALALAFACTCDAQESTRSTSADQSEAEAEPIVVSATRTDIPLERSPASVSVISSEELEEKQIERVADALREVPGLSIVQTGSHSILPT